MDPAYLRLLARRHGTRCHRILGDAAGLDDLGPGFGGGLYAREVEHLVQEEWARTAEDILWRRTKCGLHIDEAGRNALTAYLAGEAGVAAAI
jgi:glycerol-3-phosphate dehydrogenase